jgi:hypothetical protein
MKTTRLELPDGRLITIEGGEAEGTAKLIANHYLGQGPVETIESALPVPGLGDCGALESGSGGSGGQPEPAALRQVDAPVRNLPVANEGEEAPLELPAMKF